MNNFGLIFAGIACGMFLLGCGKERTPDVVSAVAPSLKEIRVGDTSQVGPQYADLPVVVTIGMHQAMRGSKLEGRLIELRTGQVAASANAGPSDTAAPEQKLIFRRATPWTPGRYLVELTLDGRMIGQQDVDVVLRPSQDAPSTSPTL